MDLDGISFRPTDGDRSALSYMNQILYTDECHLDGGFYRSLVYHAYCFWTGVPLCRLDLRTFYWIMDITTTFYSSLYIIRGGIQAKPYYLRNRKQQKQLFQP
ncbi:hypothetical protein U3A58_10175 [Algoriphagus sp. C2-6-M1]|uniref:hypothetical protein n=1 Tax=Algoriphagus persicinus TaxID=3108754 RepID=UPI002B3F1C92|nr:hypothetical protein [Algoriphagus sp. C2-6-M1]MEB2780759.1 hypothetical protein [Algoriphagus sp. C2-6-M1]